MTMYKGTIISLCALAAVAASGCNANKSGYDAEGYFESAEVTVSSEANGRILFLEIEEGDEVDAGTVLGCVDTMQLYYTRARLENSLESVMQSRPDIGKQTGVLKEQMQTLERDFSSQAIITATISLWDISKN